MNPYYVIRSFPLPERNFREYSRVRPLAESSGPPFRCCCFHLYIHSSFSISLQICVWVGLPVALMMGIETCVVGRSVGRICSLGWWCISGFKCQSSICATTRRRCGLSSDQSRILFDQPQRKKCARYSWLQVGRVLISYGTEIIGENTWWRFLIR